jgi:hypothetical protein
MVPDARESTVLNIGSSREGLQLCAPDPGPADDEREPAEQRERMAAYEAKVLERSRQYLASKNSTLTSP